MAVYLPIRALNRSQGLRIGNQKITATATHYVDISNGNTRKDLTSHSAIGAYVVVGPLSATNSNSVVREGAVVTANGTPDQAVDVSAGELLNRSTGVYVTVAAVADLAATAAHATLARIDIVQVHVTTGVASYKAGTAAATPVAATPDASNIVVATVARAATDNTIATADITDVRPRP
jgi:hypothetical protein